MPVGSLSKISLQAWWEGCDLRGSGCLKLRPPLWELVATLCANHMAELGPSHSLMKVLGGSPDRNRPLYLSYHLCFIAALGHDFNIHSHFIDEITGLGEFL